MNHHIDAAKHWLDGFSFFAVLAVLIGWLPAVAAFVTILYSAVRLYETRTVQQLLGRRPQSRYNDKGD